MRVKAFRLCMASAALAVSFGAAAQGPSTASELPTGSVVSVLGAASMVAAVPLFLSEAGVFVVKSVEASARGAVCVLERASDGARVSIEITGRSLVGGSLAAGTVLTVSVIGAGAILSAAGEAVAFIPNAIGEALLYDQRITR